MGNAPTADAALDGVDYFDGTSARARAVTLRLHGGELAIDGDGIALRVPARAVQWPERTRHGARVAHLADGGTLHCTDSAAWDAWARASGRDDGLVVRMQQSWRSVLVSIVVLALLLVALYLRGIPWMARAAVPLIPATVDERLGDAALEAVDKELMKPTALPAAEQARLRAALARAVAALPRETVPAYRLVFRKSRVGPNAFALPGGTVVLTDQLVELASGDEAMIVGVLAHELGHLRYRHGMRMLVQAAAIGAVASIALGDFSSLLAAAPVLLTEASYSRDAEREADVESVRVLRAAGYSPRAMVSFFERIAAWRERRGDTDASASADSKPGAEPGASSPDRSAGPAAEAGRRPRSGSEGRGGGADDGGLGIAIASHPPDAERIRYFEQEAEKAER
jgi:Zn-dependent protease with chaperone function